MNDDEETPSIGSGKREKHGLYRKNLTEEERSLFDHLVTDPDFDDLRREIALVRLTIERCAAAVLTGNEWRVPLQVMPQYIEKLIKLIERMRPQAQRVVLEDHLDTALSEMLNEEAAARLLQKQAASEPDEAHS